MITCKSTGDTPICLKIFLAFIFPHLSLCIRSVNNLISYQIPLFYYQMLFSELFLELYKGLENHFCHCIECYINKSFNNQGTEHKCDHHRLMTHCHWSCTDTQHW